MASQELKQRKIKDETEFDDTTVTGTATEEEDVAADEGNKAAMRMTLAKRGLKSLVLAISIPVLLTLLTIYFVPSRRYGALVKATPFWFPSITVINGGNLVSSFLTGVSAWLVWAHGGFHVKPTALYFYCLYHLLSFGWYVLMVGSGAVRIGSVLCLGKLGALFGCGSMFKGVNPTAADLVKPCLAWTAFLLIMNLTLICL